MTDITTPENFTLPTTIGSIVTFSSNVGEEPLQMVATLLVGAITEDGADRIVWGDAFTDGAGADEFTVEEILAGNPVIVHESAENPLFLPLDGEEAEARAGETVTYDDPEDGSDVPLRLTAVYAPGFIDSANGEFGDYAWINSYGGYATWAEIANGNPQVIFKGSVTF